MRQPGVPSLRRPRLPTARWLATCLPTFQRPAQPVPGHHRACGGPQILAGTRGAAPSRSVTPCRTPPRDRAHRAHGARGGSDATGQARACVPTRRQTPGVPLTPAMTTEQRVDVAPRLRGGAQRARCRWDPAGCAQGAPAGPAVVGHGLGARCVGVAALGPPQHLMPSVRAPVVLSVARAQGGHHARLCAVIRARRGLAGPLARAGPRREGHPQVAQPQDDRGPRMTEARPLAGVDRVGVCRGQTGAAWPGRLTAKRALPRQPGDAWARRGPRPGWRLRPLGQRGEGPLGLRWQAVGTKGGRQAGTPGGLCAGRRRWRAHHHAQRAGAHPRTPLTAGAGTFDPRGQGASEQRAAPRDASSARGGGEDATGKRSRGPDPWGQEVRCGRPARASLGSNNVGGPSGSTARDRCVETPQGGARGVASAGLGSGAESNRQRLVPS